MELEIEWMEMRWKRGKTGTVEQKWGENYLGRGEFAGHFRANVGFRARLGIRYRGERVNTVIARHLHICRYANDCCGIFYLRKKKE